MYYIRLLLLIIACVFFLRQMYYTCSWRFAQGTDTCCSDATESFFSCPYAIKTTRLFQYHSFKEAHTRPRALFVAPRVTSNTRWWLPRGSLMPPPQLSERKNRQWWILILRSATPPFPEQGLNCSCLHLAYCILR